MIGSAAFLPLGCRQQHGVAAAGCLHRLPLPSRWMLHDFSPCMAHSSLLPSPPVRLPMSLKYRYVLAAVQKRMAGRCCSSGPGRESETEPPGAAAAATLATGVR